MSKNERRKNSEIFANDLKAKTIKLENKLIIRNDAKREGVRTKRNGKCPISV